MYSANSATVNLCISGEVAARCSNLSIVYGLVFGTGMFLAYHDLLRTESCWSISRWGKWEESPFPSDEILQLKQLVIEVASRAAFAFSARVEIEWMFQLTTVFWIYFFAQLMILKLVSENMLKASKWVLERGCQGCLRYTNLRKWRLPSQVDPLDYLEYAPDRSGVWRRNYATLREFETQVLDVMHDQASRGQIIVMTESEARSRYPDLVVASLGAQRKQKPGGKVTARVLFGLCVNSKTRLRDQERAPIAADLKRSMREQSRLASSLSHCRLMLRRRTARCPCTRTIGTYLGVKYLLVVTSSSILWAHSVLASASYYWSRVAAAVGRLVQYLSAYTSTSWHMLFADDYLLESGGPEYRTGLLLFFVLCAVVGVPLSWHKTCGGDTLVWVGFELLLRSRCVGISARRAEWFVRWAETIASSTTIHMGSFEEGLGRIMFVAGALEHERPFLAPLYKFLTMHPRNFIRRVPPYVSFILKYLARERYENFSSWLYT